MLHMIRKRQLNFTLQKHRHVKSQKRLVMLQHSSLLAVVVNQLTSRDLKVVLV